MSEDRRALGLMVEGRKIDSNEIKPEVGLIPTNEDPGLRGLTADLSTAQVQKEGQGSRCPQPRSTNILDEVEG